MSTYYYADATNQAIGPYPLSELQALARAGMITPTTHVIENGGSTWRVWADIETEHRPGGTEAVAGNQAALYCQKCGKGLPIGLKTCSNCGAPVVFVDYAALAADKIKSASTDALHAFKLFALNPVGGLSGAFESLGPARALGVGIVFGLASALCGLFLMYNILPTWSKPEGIAGFLKILALSLVPFISLFAAHFIARMAFKGKGAAGHDVFVTGACLLPWGVVALLAGILGLANIEVIIAAAVFAVCLTILMLHVGLTRICHISERAATLAIPLILLASGWLSKIIYTTMLKDLLGNL